MKNVRNRLLALTCLLGFVWLGVLYFRATTVRKPFGVVLFVGSCLTSSQITDARLYQGGAEGQGFALDDLPNLALLSNYSNDFAVPDTAAAATAIACGVKVNNGSIAVDPEGRALRSVVDLAREKGRATGLVTNASLTGSSPAAFYAHAAVHDAENIAAQLVESDLFDVVLGGGGRDFLPDTKRGRRDDGRDLMLEMRRRGYDVVRTDAELENTAAWSKSKLFGVFGDADFPFACRPVAGSALPSLADMVRRAIEMLQNDDQGYLLIVDAGLIQRASEQNDGEATLGEIVELDRALAAARTYAGENSLIIVAGEHATGGMHINGHPFRQDKGVALLGMNASGVPSITWATGPNGPRIGPPLSALPPPGAPNNASQKSSGESPGLAVPVATPRPDPPEQPGNSARNTTEPSAFRTPVAVNTAGDVIAAGVGSGSERLKGFLDNTFIFQLIRENL